MECEILRILLKLRNFSSLGPCQISMMKIFCKNICWVKAIHYFRQKVLPEMFDWVLKTSLGIIRAAFLARSFCKAYTVNDGLTALGASLKTKAFMGGPLFGLNV